MNFDKAVIDKDTCIKEESFDDQISCSSLGSLVSQDSKERK